ncbi:MAG TPA: hypothetical protein VNO79_15215, partial [Actinomycetota bacterium]|nr:hypothetical protein [Actinomycetota bacterium]
MEGRHGEGGRAAGRAPGPPEVDHRALLEEMPAVAYVARVGDPEGSPVFYIGREVEEALGYPREA